MASPHSEGTNILFDVLFPTINFLIFSGVLFYALRKPLKQLFLSRSEDIAKNIENSTKALEDAKQKYEQAERNLVAIEDEKKRLYLRSEAEIEAFRKKSEEQLKQALDRLKFENELRVEEEIRKTRIYLKETTFKKVFEATERRFKEEMDKKDHQKLTEGYVEELFQASKDFIYGERQVYK